MSRAPIYTLLRTAALTVLLAAPAVSGCASDDARVATSGTSVPTGSSGAWVHTPNEPNWRSLPYEAH